MIKRWMALVLVFILFVVGSYVSWFRNRPIGDSSDWGTFGDYLGGVLNPLLGFATLLLLIRTLQAQREELEITRQGFEDERKEGDLRRAQNILSAIHSTCLSDVDKLDRCQAFIDEVQDDRIRGILEKIYLHRGQWEANREGTARQLKEQAMERREANKRSREAGDGDWIGGSRRRR